MKYCEDCKHFSPARGIVWLFDRRSRKIYAKCARTGTETHVFRGDTKDVSYCSTAREFDHLCGPGAKNWEKRQ